MRKGIVPDYHQQIYPAVGMTNGDKNPSFVENINNGK
jgi:hypothetical protein